MALPALVLAASRPRSLPWPLFRPTQPRVARFTTWRFAPASFTLHLSIATCGRFGAVLRAVAGCSQPLHTIRGAMRQPRLPVLRTASPFSARRSAPSNPAPAFGPPVSYRYTLSVAPLCRRPRSSLPSWPTPFHAISPLCRQTPIVSATPSNGRSSKRSRTRSTHPRPSWSFAQAAKTTAIAMQLIPAESDDLGTVSRRLDYLNNLTWLCMSAMPPDLAIQEGASIKRRARPDAIACCPRRTTHYMMCFIVSEAHNRESNSAHLCKLALAGASWSHLTGS